MTKHLPTDSLLCPDLKMLSQSRCRDDIVRPPRTADDCRMHHPWRCIEVWPEASKRSTATVSKQFFVSTVSNPDVPKVANCEC